MSTADIEELLEPGEKIEEEVEFGAGRVVVTNKRLLSFSPETSGKNYRPVDRPNVDNVAIRTRSSAAHLLNAGVAFAAGIALVGAGIALDFGGFLDVSTGTGTGATALGVSGMIDQMQALLGLIDDAIIVLGLLAALVGLAYVGLYLYTREEVVSIDVAGENDIDYPTSHLQDPRGAVENLRLALGISLERGETEGGPEWETSTSE